MLKYILYGMFTQIKFVTKFIALMHHEIHVNSLLSHIATVTKLAIN